MFNLNDYPLFTAIVTPFYENLKIDFETFKKLLQRQENVGNGVVILGSTGEGLALHDSEKREILEFTADQKLKIPVMVGVGGFNLPATLDWLGLCEEYPIQAYLMLTPLYAKPGKEGQTEWFKALLDKVSRPAMLYNVPSRTGVKLHLGALKALVGHKNFWAVKEASGSISEFQDYRAAAPSIAFYSGDDGLTPFFASAGGKGLVSVASNVWPEATRRYVELSLGGEHQNLFPVWRTASDSLFTASNPVPAKALLHELGIIPNALVRPPLSTKDLASRQTLIEANQAVESWYSENARTR